VLSPRAANALRQLPERNRFFKGLAGWIGFRQIRVDYEPAARAHGVTTFSPGRLVGLSIEGLTSFSVAPLRFASLFGALLAGGGGIWLGIHAYVPNHVVPVSCKVLNTSWTQFTCGDTDSPNIQYFITLQYTFSGQVIVTNMCELGISCQYCDRLECEQQPVQSLACLPLYSLGSTPDQKFYGKYPVNSSQTCYVYEPDPTVVSPNYSSQLSLVPLVVIVPGGILAVIIMPIYCIHRFWRRARSQSDAGTTLAY